MRQLQKTWGFSLIEVNLAILVVALGMLTLFSLFPAGLKQVETAQSSTQEAMFAGYVLSTLRGRATQINGNDWNIGRFPGQLVQNTGLQQGRGISSMRFPLESDPPQYMRYMLDISDAGNDLRAVSLWCRSGQYGATDLGAFQTGASKYYTELYYSGMP